jgi:hypothetical protein
MCFGIFNLLWNCGFGLMIDFSFFEYYLLFPLICFFVLLIVLLKLLLFFLLLLLNLGVRNGAHFLLSGIIFHLFRTCFGLFSVLGILLCDSYIQGEAIDLLFGRFI